MWLKRSLLLGISIAVMSLSTVCLGGVLKAAHVTVTGPMDRVHEFHQNLLAFLGNTTLEDAGVLCDGCGQFDAAPPSPAPPSTDAATVDYTFYRDNKRLKAFILAWGKLERRAAADVTITFDMNYVTSDCSTFVPQPCVTAPFCAGPPRGCSKSTVPPCKRCGT